MCQRTDEEVQHSGLSASIILLFSSSLGLCLYNILLLLDILDLVHQVLWRGNSDQKEEGDKHRSDPGLQHSALQQQPERRSECPREQTQQQQQQQQPSYRHQQTCGRSSEYVRLSYIYVPPWRWKTSESRSSCWR